MKKETNGIGRLLRGAGSRLVAVAAIIVLGIGGVAAAQWIKPSTSSANPPVITEQAASGTATRVCPGGVILPASSSDASKIAAVGRPAVVASPGGTGATTRISLAAPDTNAAAASAPVVVTAPSGGNAPAFGVGQSDALVQTGLRGLMSAACTEPEQSVWIVGGSTATGRASYLAVANPSDVPASVSVFAWDASGPVGTGAVTQVTVTQRSQTVIPLASILPGRDVMVLHVVSVGGRVTAAVFESVVVGLTPAGADWIGPGTEPTVQQVVAGLVLPQDAPPDAGGELEATDGTPGFRLLNPGQDSTTARVHLRSDDGSQDTVVTATLAPGAVTEVPILSLKAGTYTATITAGVPIVAAARTVTITAGAANPSDFAWLAAASPLTDAVAAGTQKADTAVLHLANPRTVPVTVTVTMGGTNKQLSVSAGASVSLAVPTGQPLTIAHATGLFGSISAASAGGLITSSNVVPPGDQGAPVAVIID